MYLFGKATKSHPSMGKEEGGIYVLGRVGYWWMSYYCGLNTNTRLRMGSLVLTPGMLKEKTNTFPGLDRLGLRLRRFTSPI